MTGLLVFDIRDLALPPTSATCCERCFLRHDGGGSRSCRVRLRASWNCWRYQLERTVDVARLWRSLSGQTQVVGTCVGVWFPPADILGIIRRLVWCCVAMLTPLRLRSRTIGFAYAGGAAVESNGWWAPTVHVAPTSTTASGPSFFFSSDESHLHHESASLFSLGEHSHCFCVMTQCFGTQRVPSRCGWYGYLACSIGYRLGILCRRED